MTLRVGLSRPSARDYPEFAALVRASRRLHRAWVSPPEERDAFLRYVARSRKSDFEGLLVRRREDGALVGVFNLSQIAYGPLCSAYLGYWAGAPFAGQGYMSAGMEAVLRHAFTRLGLHRVEANIQPGNLRSKALVERTGFRLEGYSPRYLKIAGRWRDHERWAITREDWRRRRR